jgi:hypothetical protein
MSRGRAASRALSPGRAVISPPFLVYVAKKSENRRERNAKNIALTANTTITAFFIRSRNTLLGLRFMPGLLRSRHGIFRLRHGLLRSRHGIFRLRAIDNRPYSAYLLRLRLLPWSAEGQPDRE